MGIDEKLKEIEKLTKEIESEKNFDNVVSKFSDATKLVRESLSEAKTQSGKVYEIVRELDEYIEREITVACD